MKKLECFCGLKRSSDPFLCPEPARDMRLMGVKLCPHRASPLMLGSPILINTRIKREFERTPQHKLLPSLVLPAAVDTCGRWE